MSMIYQHLRGNDSAWMTHDPVLRDGEIGVLQTPNRRAKLKVGDGERRFSALPFLDGEIRTGVNPTFYLTHGLDLRFPDALTSPITVKFPAGKDSDYYAVLTFTTGDVAPTFTTVPEVTFSGDDIFGGKFVPLANRHYTLLFWYDGDMQGAVRGV